MQEAAKKHYKKGRWSAGRPQSLGRRAAQCNTDGGEIHYADAGKDRAG
jgi:hypothetical protein